LELIRAGFAAHNRGDLDALTEVYDPDVVFETLLLGTHHGNEAIRLIYEENQKTLTVFRDPNEDDRVWVLFDWDQEGWQSFVSDPEVPPIMQEAGHKGRPQPAEFGGQYDA
jgi:SnoaL-like protein